MSVKITDKSSLVTATEIFGVPVRSIVEFEGTDHSTYMCITLGDVPASVSPTTLRNQATYWILLSEMLCCTNFAIIYKDGRVDAYELHGEAGRNDRDNMEWVKVPDDSREHHAAVKELIEQDGLEFRIIKTDGKWVLSHKFQSGAEYRSQRPESLIPILNAIAESQAVH